MSISTDELRSILQNLSEVCKDGEEGFAQAAEKASRSDLNTLFQEYSRQHGQFAVELHTALSEHGAYPSDAGTVGGTMHRCWIELRSRVSRADDGFLLAEAERGAEGALTQYRDAVAKDLPKEILQIVQRQLLVVQETFNRLRSLQLQVKSA